MQVSVRLAALPIPEYLDFHSSQEQNSWNIFQNIFLFQNIPKQTLPKYFLEISILFVTFEFRTAE